MEEFDWMSLFQVLISAGYVEEALVDMSDSELMELYDKVIKEGV